MLAAGDAVQRQVEQLQVYRVRTAIFERCRGIPVADSPPVWPIFGARRQAAKARMSIDGVLITITPRTRLQNKSSVLERLKKIVA